MTNLKTRTGRCTLAIFALIAAAVLATTILITAQPAVAQAVTVLVSNVGQTDAGHGSLRDYDQAQAFTTGSNSDGYTLTSVEIAFLSATSGAASTFTVSIHANNSGAPGASLGTLTNPASVNSDGVFAFTHSGITLDASTMYFVVVDVVSAIPGSGVLSIQNTASDNEDSSSAAGWSIGNGSLFRSWNLSGSWTSFGESKKIRVKGSAGTDPPWTGSTIHTITAKQTHELTSDGAVWYEMPNLVENRVYLLEFDRAFKSKSKDFTDKTKVKKPKLKVYKSDGTALVLNGHAVEATRIDGKKEFGYQRKKWLLPFIYLIPDDSGTYYLSVTSEIDDTGGFQLSKSTKWATSKGDRSSGDCDVSVTSNSDSCRIMPSDTTVLARINDIHDPDRFWMFPQHGVTYKLCVTTTAAAARAVLSFPTGSLETYSWLLFRSPDGGTTKCTRFTQPFRTMHLQFGFGTGDGATHNPNSVIMDYTVSYSVVN